MLRMTFAPLAMAGLLAGLAAPLAAQSVSRQAAVDSSRQAAAEKGLEYLAGKQGQDGSWDGGNVANTSLAALALLHSGSQPGEGKYGTQLAKAIDFLCDQAESKSGSLSELQSPGEAATNPLSGFPGGLKPGALPADAKKLLERLGGGGFGELRPPAGRGDFGADLRKAGTELQEALAKAKTPAARAKAMEQYAEAMKSLSPLGGLAAGQLPSATQHKLGREVDLYAATLALAEVQAQASGQSATSNSRVKSCLDKLVAAMEQSQKSDGSWIADGTYTVLTNGLAAAAIHRAYQAGANVDADVLKRSVQPRTLPILALNQLYNTASRIATLDAAARSQSAKRRGKTFRLSAAEAGAVNRELTSLQSQATAKLNAPDFNMALSMIGGEELLSYLFIGQSLGGSGQARQAFDSAVLPSVLKDQNADGSWQGKHCVTDRTFCTAAAVMSLGKAKR